MLPLFLAVTHQASPQTYILQSPIDGFCTSNPHYSLLLRGITKTIFMIVFRFIDYSMIEAA